MLDDKDIQKMIGIFATKEDIKDLKQDIGGLREAVQVLVISVDKLVKAVEDVKLEYAAIAAQIKRHEHWIHQIAKKVGIRLEL